LEAAQHDDAGNRLFRNRTSREALLERQQQRMADRGEAQNQQQRKARARQSLAEARRRRTEQQQSKADAHQQQRKMRRLHDEEKSPRKDVHQHWERAASGVRRAGYRLEVSLVGVPPDVALLNGAPEAAQRAPAPPFDEDFAALGYADDI